MGFKDELKANLGERIDPVEKQKEERKAELISKAANVLEHAKYYLIRKAKDGEYTVVGDKSIVVASTNLPYEFLKCSHDSTPRRWGKTLFGGAYLINSETHIFNLDIDPGMRNDFRFFFDQLKTMAEAEGITVKGYSVEHPHKNIKEKLPYTLKVIIENRAAENDDIHYGRRYSWSLTADFETTV